MKFPRRIQIVAPLFVTLLTLSITQAREREVRFLAWDHEIAARPLAWLDGEKRVEIRNLHPLQRSEPARIRAMDGRIDLLAMDHADPETATFSVAIPPQDGRLLVLLLPDPKAPCGLRALALEDSAQAFPWGTFRVINATDRPLLMRLGEVAKALPAAMAATDFAAPPQGNHPVLIAARDDPERPVYSSVWTADQESRRLVFIVPGTDVRLGHIALKVIPEFRDAPGENQPP